MATAQRALVRAIEVELVRLDKTKGWLASSLDMSIGSLANRLHERQDITVLEMDKIGLALGLGGFSGLARRAAEEQQHITD